MSVQFISAEELKQRILERGHVWSGEELDVFAAAVIRDASVGTAKIEVVNGHPYSHIYINGLKDGDYDIIPKEAP